METSARRFTDEVIRRLETVDLPLDMIVADMLDEVWNEYEVSSEDSSYGMRRVAFYDMSIVEFSFRDNRAYLYDMVEIDDLADR